jgi:5-methylcytosine-specific restriction endonuclease McrA
VLRIAASQGGRCAYCQRPFGSTWLIAGRLASLEITADHFIPWVLSHDSSAGNVFAVCQWCNKWKRDRFFMTVDAVQAFVERKWRRTRARCISL